MDKQAQAQPQAKKQTHAPKAEADRKNLLEAYYLAMFGKTQEDIMADIQKGEVIQEERAKIQEEKAKIQEEKAKIQEEKAKIQEERAKIQEEKRKMIVYLCSITHLSAEEIAKELGFDLAYVQSVLADLSPENNK